MATGNYILQIPNPCKEDWQQMMPDQTGRFCAHCSKTVIDFTNLTDEQIIALIERQNGKLCGRLNSEQLNRIMKAHEERSRIGYKLYKVFAGLLLLFTVREGMAASPGYGKKIINQFITSRNEPLMVNADTTRQRPETLIAIKGKVVDSLTCDGIAFANIARNKVTGCTTDAGGNFTIMAEIGDTLVVNYLGYQRREIKITDQNAKGLIVALAEQPEQMIITTGIIVHRPADEPTTTTENKVRHFFGLKPKYRYHNANSAKK